MDNRYTLPGMRNSMSKAEMDTVLDTIYEILGAGFHDASALEELMCLEGFKECFFSGYEAMRDKLLKDDTTVGNVWYIRFFTHNSVSGTPEHDTKYYFQYLTPGQQSGKTVCFFAGMEDWCIFNKHFGPSMCIKDITYSTCDFVSSFGDRTWVCTCVIQGYPVRDELEKFIWELSTSSGFEFLQIIAPDGHTVAGSFGQEGRYANQFCGSLDQIRSSDEFLAIRDENEAYDEWMEAHEEILEWAPKWSLERFYNVLTGTAPGPSGPMGLSKMCF